MPFFFADDGGDEPTFQELYDALIVHGDFAEAKSILDQTPQCINDYDADGKTVLHHAAEFGDADVVEFLLRYPNIKVNLVAEDGMGDLCDAQPLHYAAYYGHIDVVNLLIKHKKIKLNDHDGIGLTPLQEAFVENYIEVVELLLKAGADPNCPTIEASDPSIDVAGPYIPVGTTPLQMAVILQNVEIAELLLDYKANINDLFDDSKNDDLSNEGYIVQSLLDIAVKNNDHEMVKLLCQHHEDGLDFNTVDQEGLTPFFYAVIEGYDDIAKILLEYPQVEVDVYHEKYCSPFYHAVSINNLALVKELLSYKKNNVAININIKDSSELTPLHIACNRGFTEIAHLLIRTSDIELNAEDIDNFTPLNYAIQENHTAIIELLRHKRGVDSNKKIQNTGIKRALKERREEYISELEEQYYSDFEENLFEWHVADLLAEQDLSMGNVDYTHLIHPDEGLAPIHLAAKHADTHTLKAVVDFSKIDLDSVDVSKRTAIDHLNQRRKKRKPDDISNNMSFSSEDLSNDSLSCDDESTHREKSNIFESAKKRRKLEECYSSDGSSSDDSDDDFEPKPYLAPPVDKKIIDMQKQWQKKPPVDKKILIAEYRGVTFKSTFFSKKERRKKYKEIHSNQPKTIHSAASYELAAGYETDDEQLLQRSKQVHAVMLAQEQRAPSKIKKQKNKQPHSVADQDYARYINKQSGHAADLQQWHSNQIPKEKQKELSQRLEGVTFTQNPYLSFGDEAKHPLKFGYALNSNYPSSQTFPRLRQTTGKTKRPYLGYLIVALFMPEELRQSGARHAPTLIAQNRIGVGLVYKHARETAFLGYVYKKNIAAQIKLRIPSFETYKPHFQKKYGLSEIQFNQFRHELMKTQEKSDKRKSVYKKIILQLINFLTPLITDLSMKCAHERDAVLMYQDLHGGYTNKLPEITMQKQLQKDIDAMAEELSNISFDHLGTNDEIQLEKTAMTVKY